MQRIKIEGIKMEPWFQKSYVPVRPKEVGEVNLDDIRAVFDDIEVCFLFQIFFLLYSQG